MFRNRVLKRIVPPLAGALLGGFLLGGAGCGYTLVHYEGGLGEVKSVALKTPVNESYDPGVEYLVADALRREFLRRKGVRLVERPEQADLVISGRVLPIQASGSSFSTVVLSLEYELTLVVELNALRADGSPVPIDSRALRESERYLASADPAAQQKNRQEALRQAASLLAGRVYDSLYETLVR